MVGLGYRFTVQADPSRGWLGFIFNNKGLFLIQAKLLTGFIKSQTKLLWN
jgi:hypothetical protein